MAEAAAKVLQSKLTRPTLLKVMGRSHVSGGFWLGGFGAWRRGVLPDVITDLALELRGEHWPVRWLSEAGGLSGGWRTFVLDQKLVEGDYMLLEKKDDKVLKAFLFRAADYQDGATPDQDSFFEDAADVDYKGRRVASAAVKEGTKAPAKRKAAAEPPAGGAAKKPRGAAAAAAAAAVAGPSGSQPMAGPEVAAGGAAAGGSEQASGNRRNPVRDRGMGVQQRLQALQDLQAAAFKKSPRKTKAAAAAGKAAPAGGAGAGRKPRAPADPNAPKKVRAPPKPKDPNAPARAASKKKKSNKGTAFTYEFPAGKASEMIAILKARHQEVCRDCIRVDKKNGAILDGYRPGLTVRGYKNCLWEHLGGTYRPIHVIPS